MKCFEIDLSRLLRVTLLDRQDFVPPYKHCTRTTEEYILYVVESGRLLMHSGGEDLELSLRVAAYFPVVLSKKITATYQKENSVATKDKSFDPDWKFFDTVEELYADSEIPLPKKENIKKVMGWFTMRRCRHYIIDGQKSKAWKAFKDTPKDSASLKDRMINLVLLMLPAALVRTIFAARWRGKA
jgi:hypothetical protein